MHATGYYIFPLCAVKVLYPAHTLYLNRQLCQPPRTHNNKGTLVVDLTQKEICVPASFSQQRQQDLLLYIWELAKTHVNSARTESSNSMGHYQVQGHLPQRLQFGGTYYFMIPPVPITVTRVRSYFGGT